MNRFCSECGHKLEVDQVFCPECGTQQKTEKVEQQQAPAQPNVPAQPQAPIQHQAPKPPRKPMTLKKKVGLTLVVLLAAGGVAGHQMIKANTEPQQKVDAFLQGLYEGDMDSAMGEIIVPKDTVSDPTAFQEYLVEQDLTEFKSRFYEAGSGVVEDGITRVVLHENGTELFKVKESKFIGNARTPMVAELAERTRAAGKPPVETMDGRWSYAEEAMVRSMGRYTFKGNAEQLGEQIGRFAGELPID